MRRWNTFTSAGVMALAVMLAACAGDDAGGRASPMEPVFTATTTLQRQKAFICKDGPFDTYTFELSATGGNLYSTTANATATGDPKTACTEIWSSIEGMAPASVTVTELVPTGMKVDSIFIVRTDAEGDFIFPGTKLTDTNTATATGLDFSNGAYFAFYNSDLPDEPPGNGTEGCTPGYWKQKHHFGNWRGYSPNDQFSSVFENAFPGMTLVQVVAQGGGGLKALGRHTVAALLNGSGDVDYAMSAQQVIDAFNAAYPGGDYEGLKDVFEGYNERGCPLGRAE